MNRILSLDTTKTWVVLIGASTFPKDRKNLPSIPHVKNNIRDLALIFADSKIIGIPQKNIVTILNEPIPYNVEAKLAQVARKAKDTLIVYYTGHGFIGNQGGWEGKLLLAVKNTIMTEAISTGISTIHFDTIRHIVLSSPAKKKILIVDCCFSGRILTQTYQAGTVENLFQGQIDIIGSYAIASAPANKTAIAKQGEKYTAFSAELIKTLKEGIDNNRSGINLEELYTNIRSELRKKSESMPEPQRANFQDADEIVIALNQFSSKSLPEPDLSPNIVGVIGWFAIGLFFCMGGFIMLIQSCSSNDISQFIGYLFLVFMLFLIGGGNFYACWKTLRGEEL